MHRIEQHSVHFFATEGCFYEKHKIKIDIWLGFCHDFFVGRCLIYEKFVMDRKINLFTSSNTQNIAIENDMQDNALNANEIDRGINVVDNADAPISEKIALFNRMIVELPHRKVVKWYEDNVKNMSLNEIKHMQGKVYPCIGFDAQAKLDEIKALFGDQVKIYVKKTGWSGIKEADISLTAKNILPVDLEWFLNKIQGIQLGSLKFIDCENMKAVDLSALSCVEKCFIKNCKLLQKVIMPNNARNVRGLYVETCKSLEEIGGLSECQFIQEIEINRAKKLKNFPDLSGLSKLESLSLSDIKWFDTIGISFANLVNLRHLRISSIIGGLERCPDLSALTELRTLTFEDMCLGPDDGEFLIELPGLSQLKNLEVLKLFYAATGLRNADELSELTNLRELVALDEEVLVCLNGLRLLSHAAMKKIKMDCFVEGMDISGAVNLEHLSLNRSDCDLDLSKMVKLKKVKLDLDYDDTECYKRIIISRNCPFAQEPEAQEYPFIFDDEMQEVQGSIDE